MRCPDRRCRHENEPDATSCAACGKEIQRPGACWSDFFASTFGWVLVATILYLNVGGIYFAFSRHGGLHGIVAVFVPPYAWYRAVSPLWDTPKWERDALDKVETLAYVVLNAQSDEIAERATIAERIPGLRRLYQKQSIEFRLSLDRSLTDFVELIDVIGHDVLDEVVDRGTLTIDKSVIVQKHRALYDSATDYEGLRAALEATMMDVEYVEAMFSLWDIESVLPEDRDRLRDAGHLAMRRWKAGAIHTKDRILR